MCACHLSRSCACRNIWLLLSCSIVFVGFCFLLLLLSKHRHILNVSSAPSEATVLLSGPAASCIILPVCPLRSATLLMHGYFHRDTWLCGIPWPDASSRFSSDHSIEQTCKRARHYTTLSSESAMLIALVTIHNDMQTRLNLVHGLLIS